MKEVGIDLKSFFKQNKTVFRIIWNKQASLGAFCTSGSDGCHQTVQLNVPVTYMFSGVPQLLLYLLPLENSF